MKKIVIKNRDKANVVTELNWEELLSMVKTWTGIIVLVVSILGAIVLKIKNEIGFWRWIFRGMPDTPEKKWYAGSLIGSVVFCVVCLILAIVESVNERIQEDKRTMEDRNEDF